MGTDSISLKGRRLSSSLVRQRQERAVELWARSAGCWFGDDADFELKTDVFKTGCVWPSFAPERIETPMRITVPDSLQTGE